MWLSSLHFDIVLACDQCVYCRAQNCSIVSQTVLGHTIAFEISTIVSVWLLLFCMSWRHPFDWIVFFLSHFEFYVHSYGAHIHESSRVYEYFARIHYFISLRFICLSRRGAPRKISYGRMNSLNRFQSVFQHSGVCNTACNARAYGSRCECVGNPLFLTIRFNGEEMFTLHRMNDCCLSNVASNLVEQVCTCNIRKIKTRWKKTISQRKQGVTRNSYVTQMIFVSSSNSLYK